MILFSPSRREGGEARGGKVAKKIRNRKELKELRTQLRKSMPAPEVILWTAIRNNALGTKFRRQFSIHNYILDFYAPSARIALEIDGESHFQDEDCRIRDKIRDKNLFKLGIKVLRFTNKDIIDNLDGVIEKINSNLPPLNLPLSMGEKR